MLIFAGSEVKIYFKDDIDNIEHFFDSQYDPHAASLSLIDLTYLTTDHLTQANSVFKGCSSLQSVHLAL